MKVVYTEKKINLFFIPQNKFLVPILLTPLENNPGAATEKSNMVWILWNFGTKVSIFKSLSQLVVTHELYINKEKCNT